MCVNLTSVWEFENFKLNKALQNLNEISVLRFSLLQIFKLRDFEISHFFPSGESSLILFQISPTFKAFSSENNEK